MRLGSRNNQHSFAQIPDVKIGRSQFDRSHTVKDTFDFDYLIPIYLDEVIPGDTYNVRMAAFARLATQAVPIMDNMYVDFFFFYVPNRIVYDKWEQMMGATVPDPDSTTDYINPTMTFPSGGPEVDSIFDKMGLPTDVVVVGGWTLENTLPFRAYNKIWDDWFKDQNLQDGIVQNRDEGPDLPADYALLKRAKKHDYFTACLPWPQKGDPASLALAGQADVILNPNFGGVPSTGFGMYLKLSTGVNSGNFALQAGGGGVPTGGELQQTGTGNPLWLDPGTATNGESNLIADLSTSTAVTINELRQAFMMQELLELDARGGTRYVEILRSHFGVVSPDFRLQRSEFLGGGSIPINIHPVAQTSPTSGSNAQGQLASFATASAGPNNGIGFSKSFVEHGYIIGLACARADITYQQGLNRLWSRSTKYDYFWPKLQQLGEQEVLNKEIYMQGTAADNEVFGYQERYAEYRYRPSEIHGRFRSTYATPLDMWHLAEEFSALPVLNASFIVQNTPIERAIVVDTEPDLLFDAYFHTKCARPMMTYSVPASLGRF